MAVREVRGGTVHRSVDELLDESLFDGRQYWHSGNCRTRNMHEMCPTEVRGYPCHCGCHPEPDRDPDVVLLKHLSGTWTPLDDLVQRLEEGISSG